MPVTFELDPGRRRAIVTVPAGTRWADFERTVISTVEKSPELTGWNLIIDDQLPMDDVDVTGMIRIAETYRRLASEPERSTHTIVITTDRFFEPWARVIDLNFGARKHHSAPDLTAAMALMDRLDADMA